MTRATKLGSPAAGQSVLTRLCPSSRPSPSPAPLSAWEQGRSITVAIVFSNKQLQEAWAKFLSNLFPDDKYTPLIITVENNTNRSTNWVEGPAPWQESSKNEESKFILDEEQRKMTVHMKRRSSSVTKGWPGSECFSSVRDLISRQSEFYLTQFKSYRCPDYTEDLDVFKNEGEAHLSPRNLKFQKIERALSDDCISTIISDILPASLASQRQTFHSRLLQEPSGVKGNGSCL